MTKRFTHNGIVIVDHLKKDLIYIGGDENLLDLVKYLDTLQYENEQLKQELKVYRKIASCSNCHYHDYDTLFGGDDEYEICEKGNDVADGICNEWREL